MSSRSFLRQLSAAKDNRKPSSRRWTNSSSIDGGGGRGSTLRTRNWTTQMEGLKMTRSRKRVMVVVDQTSNSKHAMIWTLTHVVNKGDLVTLLHVLPPPQTHDSDSQHGSAAAGDYLGSSLASLCKACKPEVEVEALVIQGPKLAIVLSQVKKLGVSVLVLGQKKASSPFISCLCGPSPSELFVDECINRAECLTIGVRKQSQGMGGYLISTRWQKNFWLLA